jgi:hypothetical protein
MILRPLQPAAALDDKVSSAWQVVERSQKQQYDSCWLVTQPSHAALSGEIATRITAPQFPKVDEQIVRAIALHDAGWGIPDAQAITGSRAVKARCPKSFLDATVDEYLEAWTQSVEVAQKVSPAGGYIVSRHFWRIAEPRAKTEGSAPDRKKLEKFLQQEAQRQKKLAAKEDRSGGELERLTDLLQFCDLLSLYICCGAQGTVTFPAYCGIAIKLVAEPEGYRFEPPIVEPGSQFSFAALRCPATKEISAQEIRVEFL